MLMKRRRAAIELKRLCRSKKTVTLVELNKELKSSNADTVLADELRTLKTVQIEGEKGKEILRYKSLLDNEEVQISTRSELGEFLKKRKFPVKRCELDDELGPIYDPNHLEDLIESREVLSIVDPKKTKGGDERAKLFSPDAIIVWQHDELSKYYENKDKPMVRAFMEKMKANKKGIKNRDDADKLRKEAGISTQQQQSKDHKRTQIVSILAQDVGPKRKKQRVKAF